MAELVVSIKRESSAALRPALAEIAPINSDLFKIISLLYMQVNVLDTLRTFDSTVSNILQTKLIQLLGTFPNSY